jgi:hypothetical protein
VSAVISSHATATGGLSAGILSALGPATGVVIAVAALGAVFMIASIAVTARRREPNLAVVQAAGATPIGKEGGEVRRPISPPSISASRFRVRVWVVGRFRSHGRAMSLPELAARVSDGS